MKFYVAIYDKKVKRFKTWDECKRFVSGKKNILYKSFTNEEDAKKYIKANTKAKPKLGVINTLYAYVDGSCDGSNGYGSGVSFVYNDKEIHTITKFGNKYAYARQIVGELDACLSAVSWAVEKKYKRVVIVYDYMGIEAWYTGTWKSKEIYVKEYIEEMNKLAKQIKIDFYHVNSHINDGSLESEWNNRADYLAKVAVGNVW